METIAMTEIDGGTKDKVGVRKYFLTVKINSKICIIIVINIKGGNSNSLVPNGRGGFKENRRVAGDWWSDIRGLYCIKIEILLDEINIFTFNYSVLSLRLSRTSSTTLPAMTLRLFVTF